jgi:hypothetical protein
MHMSQNQGDYAIADCLKTNERRLNSACRRVIEAFDLAMVGLPRLALPLPSGMPLDLMIVRRPPCGPERLLATPLDLSLDVCGATL